MILPMNKSVNACALAWAFGLSGVSGNSHGLRMWIMSKSTFFMVVNEARNPIESKRLKRKENGRRTNSAQGRLYHRLYFSSCSNLLFFSITYKNVFVLTKVKRLKYQILCIFAVSF